MQSHGQQFVDHASFEHASRFLSIEVLGTADLVMRRRRHRRRILRLDSGAMSREFFRIDLML
jgi:hypothetical protein